LQKIMLFQKIPYNMNNNNSTYFDIT